MYYQSSSRFPSPEFSRLRQYFITYHTPIQKTGKNLAPRHDKSNDSADAEYRSDEDAHKDTFNHSSASRCVFHTFPVLHTVKYGTGPSSDVDIM